LARDSSIAHSPHSAKGAFGGGLSR
jgi:hypothetical protein